MCLSSNSLGAAANRAATGLLRVQLDDQLFLDRQFDVLALRQLDDAPGEALRSQIEPCRDAPGARRLDARLDLLVRAALLLDRHRLSLPDPKGRDGDLAVVDRDVPVPDE